MQAFRLADSDYIEMMSGVVNKKYFGIRQESYDKYSPELIGLGNLTIESKPFLGVCAFFDLEGFTHFTEQRDSELAIPKYMNAFLHWFFVSVKAGSIHEKTNDGYLLWHKFPIMLKFLGDGFMIIWDTVGLTQFEETNIIGSCQDICQKYNSDFLKTILGQVADAPTRLRCGIAKGKILTIGNGDDFIGPVVNLAARLQKLETFTFAWATKGIDLDDPTKNAVKRKWIHVNVPIRGMDHTENVYVSRQELENIGNPEEKRIRILE